MHSEAKPGRSGALFLTFLKIGAFTFGGGYAMIPLIQRETVEKRNWITNEDVLDIVAVAESTPGPIAVNSATFVGYRIGGFWGALCATLGVVLPSFLIISVVALFLKQFEELKLVQYAFVGVRAGVLALVLHALYTLFRQCPKNIFGYVIMALAFLIAGFTQINVLWVIAAAAAAGIVRQCLLCRKGGETA